jgi:hypothetical protein
MVHAEMYESWGYTKLAEKTENRAITEINTREAHQPYPLPGRPSHRYRAHEVQIGEETPRCSRTIASPKARPSWLTTAPPARGELNDYGTQELLKSS